MSYVRKIISLRSGIQVFETILGSGVHCGNWQCLQDYPWKQLIVKFCCLALFIIAIMAILVLSTANGNSSLSIKYNHIWIYLDTLLILLFLCTFYFSPNYLLWERGSFSRGVITSIITAPSACLMCCRWLKGGSCRRDLGKEHFRIEEMKIIKMKVIIRSLKRKSMWY